MTHWRIWLLGLLALTLFSCAPQPEASDTNTHKLDPYATEPYGNWQAADPEKGEALFQQPLLAGAAGCTACHSLAPDVVLVGPSLHGIATTAETRIPNVRPDNYLYLAITNPDQHIVDGYSPSIMPNVYATELTQEDINNLVSYLMSLTKSELP